MDDVKEKFPLGKTRLDTICRDSLQIPWYWHTWVETWILPHSEFIILVVAVIALICLAAFPFKRFKPAVVAQPVTLALFPDEPRTDGTETPADPEDR